MVDYNEGIETTTWFDQSATHKEIPYIIEIIESINQELYKMADDLFEKYYRKLDDNICMDDFEKAYQKVDNINDALFFVNYRNLGNHCICRPTDTEKCRYCKLKEAFDKFIEEYYRNFRNKFIKEFGYRGYEIWLEMQFPNIEFEDINKEELLIKLYYSLDHSVSTHEELECNCNGVTPLCRVCRADKRIRWRSGP